VFYAHFHPIIDINSALILPLHLLVEGPSLLQSFFIQVTEYLLDNNRNVNLANYRDRATALMTCISTKASFNICGQIADGGLSANIFSCPVGNA
jgi:hypothetical protein